MRLSILWLLVMVQKLFTGHFNNQNAGQVPLDTEVSLADCHDSRIAHVELLLKSHSSERGVASGNWMP